MQALIFSVPGRSLLLLQVLHSHICTRVGSKHLPHPAPHSHPQSSSASTSATTSCGLLLSVVWVKKRKRKKAIQNCCGQASKKKPVVRGQEQPQELRQRKPGGQRGKLCCRHPPREPCVVSQNFKPLAQTQHQLSGTGQQA